MRSPRYLFCLKRSDVEREIFAKWLSSLHLDIISDEHDPRKDSS